MFHPRLLRTAPNERGPRRARAGAIVEFAAVLPLLVTVLFGIIEYGWVFMARQTLQHAAREGCRISVLKTSSDYDDYYAARMRIHDVLATAGLEEDCTVIMTHADDFNAEEEVELRVPYGKVSPVWRPVPGRSRTPHREMHDA
jgi:hypothetical protein